MATTQKNRTLQLTTPLGDDVLLLKSFTGSEEISRLFSFHLELLSLEDWIAPNSIVGKKISFGIRKDGSDDYRPFHGFVSRFSAKERSSGYRRYEAEVVPWLWFLTQTADCRIFQDKSVPQIVEILLGEFGFTSLELALKGSHPKWEYCVQYRESAFNFISRLLEQEGIYYYFRHDKTALVMVLSDHVGGYKKCEEGKVDYLHTPDIAKKKAGVTSWEHQFEFTAGRVAQTDDNFDAHPARGSRTPAELLLKSEKSLVSLAGNDKYELFDYPCECETPEDVAGDTKLRIEEEEAAYDVPSGASDCKTFTIGGKFSFEHHDCGYEVGKTYTITSLNHMGVEGAGYLGNEDDSFDEYSNSFTCIPENVPFRPRRTTPKPVIQGSQTATVTGPDGEEIYTDKYGRVKVQFHWDRKGTRKEDSSCWIRCTQSAAGKSWGAMSIPRIGQEVCVTFLEGDPDWPLVTGTVYNADQMPAYDLPQEKTKTYFKSSSTKGGEGYNELRFEDLADKEQIYIHAQRDMDVRVRNDSRERVVGHRDLIVGYEKDGKKGGDQTELVFQDKKLNIKRHQVEHIEGNFQLMVGGGECSEGGNLAVVIEKQVALSIGKDGAEIKIDGDQKIEISGASSLTVDGDQNTKIGQNYAIEAGMVAHVKGGMDVVIEAAKSITLKVGGSFINISPVGIFIKGTMVMINSGGAAGAGPGAKPKKPKAADKAKPDKAKKSDRHKTGRKSTPY